MYLHLLKRIETMSTIIYPSPIFGPIHSRRLGVSLGVNLQPGDGKSCTFDCVYCECGFNADFRPHTPRPSRQAVADAHPDFLHIIEDTIRIRDKHFPNAKVSVLSNATMIGKEEVRKALMMVDNNILKLDTIDPEYIRLVDRPTQPSYDVRNVIENMKKFDGHCIIQTMFMTGTTQGKSVDNTGDEVVIPWLEAVKAIAPEMVMIYTIDRETPDHDLKKASHETQESLPRNTRRYQGKSRGDRNQVFGELLKRPWPLPPPSPVGRELEGGSGSLNPEDDRYSSKNNQTI